MMNKVDKMFLADFKMDNETQAEEQLNDVSTTTLEDWNEVLIANAEEEDALEFQKIIQHCLDGRAR